MSKHTPGPWAWMEDRWWGGYSGLYGPNGEDVVVPQTSNDGDTGAAWFEELTDADRDLIAAAPELLEALKQIISNIEPDADDPGRCYRLNNGFARWEALLAEGLDAIAKAEERS